MKSILLLITKEFPSPIWRSAILRILVNIGGVYHLYTESVNPSANGIDLAWIMNGICELYRFVCCYCITAVYPLYCTYKFPQQSVPLFSDCRILYSIDSLLNDMNGVHYFREYLRQNQGIELLLFWIEVEIYKDYYYEKSNDSTTIKKIKVIQIYSQALRIFDKFIKNDAEYKIDETVIESQICYDIATTLGQQDKYEIYHSGASSSRLSRSMKRRKKKKEIAGGIQHFYSFPTSKMYQLQNIFDSAQDKCYQLLKQRHFPRFLANPLCDGLLNKLKIEERFYDALKRSHMI